MDPLDCMVEDCWLHLFQFLSAKDKQTLCHTCETFHAMLQPEKVQWGLELVLPIIQEEFENTNSHYDQRRKERMKTVVKLRRVCKAWREGVDKLIRSKDSLYRFNSDIYGYSPKLKKFLKLFKDHQGNPFIGRRVSLDVVPSGVVEPEEESDNENADESVPQQNENNARGKKVKVPVPRYRGARERARILKTRERLMTLLTKFGKEIDHLYLGRMQECPSLEAYKFLQIVLCNCPKLLTLEVSWNLRWHWEDEENKSRFQRRFEKYFEMSPLPKVNMLRELKLCEMNPQFEKLVLDSCASNLQSLKRYNSSEIPVTIWGNMNCLRYLKLCYSSFEQIETLLQAIKSPLETLSLKRGTYNETNRFFKIDKFLLAIQHLPLKKVKVSTGYEGVKESAPFPDDFPMNKTISEFSIKAGGFSLSFLRFLPELESFVVNGADCFWKALLMK